MSAAKLKIDQFMPKKKSTRLVQAQIDNDVHEKIKRVLDKEGWTWHDFMTGLMRAFLEQKK